MEAEGPQTPKQRPRKTKSLNPGSPEPKPQVYPSNERAGRVRSPQTDGFRVDEGYTDPPRSKSSAVRMGPLPVGSISQVAQTPPATPIPKRQQAMVTRQLPPRTTRKIAPLPEVKAKEQSLSVQIKQMHWPYLAVGLGVITTLVLWLVGSTVLTWGTQRFYDLRYGNPRTFQTDMAVGHGDDSQAKPSHFIAMNLNNRAVIVELKAGDPKQVVTYEVPITIMDDGQSPVTVSFRDVNNDRKLDMVIKAHLAGQEQLSFFINDGEKFRPATNNDNISI